ncbi:MAG: Asp-tRNA(Asn)/Glu-tRNA(Gln) amidotransferase GatCAB subunit B [Phototrophicales bacterium]|nr:MAG: Asp-tRNA(Asn)/Glu-tRNA(Gln) amidotransferase GatCAB subunit B [Phototrophicales bacterium]
MKYEPVIGLEIHAELLTNTKMFCRCPVVDPTISPPNTAVCVVCTGQPGVLPVINKRAVEYAIMVGLALNCEIRETSIFARKNYFYPDLPKGYQISQYEYPLCINGWLDIELENGQTKRIGIRRAHLEEDTAKNTHLNDGTSLIDFNRSGVALLEIVTEPDLRSAEEVEAFARKLRAILQYLGVNNGDMSKGVLRMEPNISVRPIGSDELWTRTEVKNLNSIRNVARATAYEIERQISTYESGGQVIQQTMGWDELRQITVPQRGKEDAHDYRYFPEPDLPPLQVSHEWIEEIRAKMPELPDVKRQRYMDELGLGEYDASVLVADRAIAEWFELAVSEGGDPKNLANWIIVEMFRLMNKDGLEREQISEIKIQPAQLVALIKLVEDRIINNNTAKKVLATMYAEGGDPVEIVKAQGLAQETDSSVLQAAIEQVLDENPDEVQRWLNGEEKVEKFLFGQVMRALKGKADAQILGPLLNTALRNRHE